MIDRLLRRPVTLVYHGVGPVDDAADPRRLVVSPGNLESHVRLLRRLGYRFRTAEELAADGGPRPGSAVLTFDDGWLNWLTYAVPLLVRLGVRGTFYVCPGKWGGQHPGVTGAAGRLLDEGQARELHAAGMELGSHALSHCDLTSVPDDELARELSESKAAIERITGRPCRTLAYPFGRFDDRVIEAAARAGYELAFAWLPSRWRPLAAPRLPGPPRHGAGRLALKLTGVRRRELRWAPSP